MKKLIVSLMLVLALATPFTVRAKRVDFMHQAQESSLPLNYSTKTLGR